MNDPDLLLRIKAVVAVGLLGIFWTWETWAPLVAGRSRRLRHGLRNWALALLNIVVVGGLMGVPTVLTLAWADETGFGLLRQITVSPWVATVPALVLLDGWTYLWHRANHAVPLLWRLHRVHHGDPEMDVSTATRFHTGEILLSALLRLPVLVLLGIGLAPLVLYETVLLAATLFHHGNVGLPERWDRRIRLLIVSPAMHRVHHSRLVAETNSNYASVLSIWDRLARTYRMVVDPRRIRLGLDGWSEDRWQTVPGMLRSPFSADPIDRGDDHVSASTARPGSEVRPGASGGDRDGGAGRSRSKTWDDRDDFVTGSAGILDSVVEGVDGTTRRSRNSAR